MLHPHRIAVIANPHSGNKSTARQWSEIDQALKDKIGDYTLFPTEHPGHASELVCQALHDGYDRIVSAGGDGTNNEVINGFFENHKPINPAAAMALLPLGTGSDLARTLQLQRGIDAILYIIHDVVVAADVGLATYTLSDGSQASRYFINVCHAGMGGAVAKASVRFKALGGFLTYLMATMTTLSTYKNAWCETDVDGVQFKQLCRDIIIAKGQYDGGGMHVAPKAQLDNGLFEIYVLGDMSIPFALSHIGSIYHGRLLEIPDKVSYHRARKITIHSPETVLINLDGEQPGQLPATFEVIPRALNLVVPR